jgi:hypothetical protein
MQSTASLQGQVQQRCKVTFGVLGVKVQILSAVHD